VKIGWDCRFGDAIALSCRKNATLFDPRLPGGAGTGKVTGYSLSCSGDGKIRGHVQIECAIGYGDSINEITGTPEYASAGYAQVGYQLYDGRMGAHGSGDTTFSRPVFGGGFDDGLSFPLRWQDVMDHTQNNDGSITPGLVSGDLVTQAAAIEKSFATLRLLAWYEKWLGQSISTANGQSGGTTQSTSYRSPDLAWALLKEQLAMLAQNTPYVMEANPISWSCLLKPCAGNGPFGGVYAIHVSPLVVPQGINLEAPSSP
jgi:hypothetical protein